MVLHLNTAETIKSLFELLRPTQKEIFIDFYKTNGRRRVVLCARRLGKTYLLCVIAIATALHKSNSQIRYASVTQKSVRKMIHPIIKEITRTMPSKLRPKWNGQEGAYLFPNGSQIHAAGCNGGHADDLRGTAADLAIVDEAAFIDDLKYLVESVLMPQLLTVPDSKLIMASSPPLSPAHDFVDYINQCRSTGHFSSYDITQGGYRPEIVEEFITEAGGRNSTTCRREYFNEIIVDGQYAIVPEFKKEMVADYTAGEFDRFYHRYVAMDIGVIDLTAIIFAVYNFREARLYIIDEIILEGHEVTTANIASLVKSKELELGITPYRRISDNNNLILLQDLGSDSGLHFLPTNKDTLVAMVNEMRLWVQADRIRVSPKCFHVTGCLEFGIWDLSRKAWGRSNVYKHFDALASLMYLIRNIDQHTNPIPTGTGTTPWTHYTPPDLGQHTLAKLFG